ncbi:MAG TPA: fumarylacetoacetate hydrolase family protein [Kineosporiaceae bacterium]
MSYLIGRRHRDGRRVPCLRGPDGVVRDASGRVADWAGPALDPRFLADLEEELLARPATLPPLSGPPGHALLPMAGGRTLACVGQNFVAHAAEASLAPPAEPTVYLKPFYTLVPSGTRVVLPRDCRTVTWEGELAVVIGRAAHRLPDPDAAAAVVAGYAPSNDLGDCDWLLHRGGQWVKGKAFPGFNPLGRWLLVGHARHPGPAVTLVTRVNGRLVQRAALREMTWSPAHLVWYTSQFLCLAPGDVLNCGTPAGTALATGAYLRPGDRVEVTVDGVGRQLISLVAPAAALPTRTAVRQPDPAPSGGSARCGDAPT